MRQRLWILWLVSSLFLWSPLTAVAWHTPEEPWISEAEDGSPELNLYYFWSVSCPYCKRARPFVEQLAQDLPWLQLHSYDVTANEDNATFYNEMAASIGQNAFSVPGFMVCGVMLMGFDSEDGMGKQLRELIEDCYRQVVQNGGADAKLNGDVSAQPLMAPTTPLVSIPLLGQLDVQQISLPLLTLVLGGLDAFNPCAFFVLLFLLSLLVHARNRARMLLIGGIFVFFSGFIYFIFMAAWLNIFLLLGELQLITLIAGLTAIGLGMLNVKDFFWFQQGPTLSISDKAKPGLFRRMRALVSSDHPSTLVFGTVTLAIAVNAYELLCTAGFPMVYTRTLTLHELSSGGYYFYLLLYNVVYIIPLFIIMLAFVYTLGSRKLQEHEGRLLKLMSGAMMLGLGVMLTVYPEGLSQAGVAILVLIAALGATGLIALFDKIYRQRHA